MLEINNITVCYKERPSLKNFSMTLETGKIASLVGESGSGKTTVIRAVLRRLQSPMDVLLPMYTVVEESALSLTLRPLLLMIR